MKILFTTLLAVTLAALTSLADVSVKISDVHLCCGKCVNGVKKAAATVPGVTADINADEGTVTLTAADKDTLQKGGDALTDAGYFGTLPADAPIKLSTDTGAKGAKVSKLTIAGVHLCCGKCVKAANEALAKVPGVTGNTATKGAKTFDVTGDFTDTDVIAALQKIGLTGKIQ